MTRFQSVCRVVAAVLLLSLAGLPTVGCTPRHSTEKSGELARMARLLPAVEVERASALRLSRQVSICLVSAGAREEREQLLPSAQRGLASHFAAVGVEPTPMSYLEMLAVRPCESSVYLFYIDPICTKGSASGCAGFDRFRVSVVQRTDGRVMDQMTVRLRQGFWQVGGTDSGQLIEIFDELGDALTID